MSNIIQTLEKSRAEIESWFEYMYRHPELSMKEEKTAKYIAGLVKSWGYEVETGVGKHGIVIECLLQLTVAYLYKF